MESLRLVSLRLPDATLAALSQAARSEGRAPADLIRAAIARDMAVRAHPLSRLDAEAVAAAAATAPDWHRLQRRLRAAGAVLRLHDDGGLWLHAWPSDRPLGPAALWGLDRGDLTARFAAPFPGAVAGG
ncbi:MAG: CopG family transcriptional regulator [Paracoccaceae bacterium]